MTKKLSLSFLLVAVAFIFATAQNNPFDECANAFNIDTLPQAPNCTESGGITSGRPVLLKVNNAGATFSPSSGACISYSSDVWYKFRATGNELRLAFVADSIHSLQPPLITVYSGDFCNQLVPLKCIESIDNGNPVIMNASPGSIYYLQIAGKNLSDQGEFTLSLSNNNNCDLCALATTLNIDPVPASGSYLPGQVVKFCFTVTDYNKTALNWIHGIIPAFGSGWDTTTLLPVSIPPSCASIPGAYWGFYNSVTSAISQKTYGPGFFYETLSGSLNNGIDNNPGNNYGDAGAGVSCPLTFCWQIKTRTDISNNTDLSVKIKTAGDSESGSWTSTACENDPTPSFSATLVGCAAPLVSSVNTSCGLTNGRIIAMGQGSGPWRYRWTSSLDTNVIEHANRLTADTLSNLAAGYYFLTVFNGDNCPATASFVIQADAGQTPSVSIFADRDTVCQGTLVTYTATSVVGGNQPAYQWKKNNINVGENSPIYMDSALVNEDSVWVVMTSSASCVNTPTVSSNRIQTFVRPTPATPIATSNSPVATGDTIYLNATTIQGASYRWTGPLAYGVNGQSVYIPSANVSMSGTYTVYATINGCTGKSSSVVVIVDSIIILSGKIKTELPNPVEDVHIEVKGTHNQYDAVTDMSGTYSFQLPLTGTDTIAPWRIDRITNNGVTIADYLTVQRYAEYGSIVLTTPYKLIAADVNSSNTVDTTDGSLILQMSLNERSDFPGGKLWTFVPANYSFPNRLDPFPYPDHSLVSQTQTIYDFTGVKLGDVNNTWDPYIRSSPDTASLAIPSISTPQNSNVTIPVMVRGFRSISGLQFTLQWDPYVMEYLNTSSSAGFKTKVVSAEHGHLQLAAFATDYKALTLTDNSIALNISFHVLGDTGDVSAITILKDSTAFTRIEILDSALAPLPVGLTAGQLRIDNSVISHTTDVSVNKISVDIVPNPFSSYTNIMIETSKTEDAELRLMNELGQEIKTIHTKLERGQSRVAITENLAAGNYLMQVITGDLSKTFKLICLGPK